MNKPDTRQPPKADIFIVDDELENIQTLSSLLKRHGYAVRGARDGKTALTILNAWPADLILLDILMPHMDGYQVCHQFKADARTRDIPVIFISALDDIADKSRAFQAGGVDYIVKPFQEEEVLMRLSTHLSLNRLQKELQQQVAEQTRELTAANAELRQEIAVRRAAEQRSRRLSVAIECAAEDIIITDRYGAIEYVNPAFEQITGYCASEVIGRNPNLLKSGRHDPAFYQAMWQTLLGKRIWKGRLINRKKDGTLFEQDANIAPILDHVGEISGFVSVKRDVSEQEALKKQLIQAQKMEAIGTLSGGIAHDFNNILAGIIGYMELAIEELAEQLAPSKKLERYLQRTLEAGNRAISLVKQILQFSRRDMSAMTVVPLQPLIKETLRLLQATLPQTIAIQLDCSAGQDIIKGDPSQIHQVLMNLCTNAYHAMRETGGQLFISLENVTLNQPRQAQAMTIPPGPYLRIKIQDTGPGIPFEYQDRIFEPYFTTKEPDEGTGLGLSVTLGIVQSHGGLIEVESNPGQGAEFRIFLPSESAQPEASTGVALFIPMGNKEKVMVIDDEAFFLEAIQEQLRGLGYQVTAIQQPKAALAAFQAEPDGFDLIITDQTMPEMTGVQLTEAIRKLDPDVPIILCTGYSEMVTEQTAKAFGVTKFLMKPVHRQALATAIRAVLQKE